MKKLLIIGRGQIGTALAERLTEFDTHVWKHDIDDLTIDALQVIRPDVVINAAGKTDLAWCEANAREALRCNLEAPVQLYRRILAFGKAEKPEIRFLHLSSGCIWDGPYDAHGRPFTPESAPSPACLYSWTKAASDALLLELDDSQLAILRPRQVYSASSSPRNTLVKLTKYPKLVDTPNSMSGMNIIERTVRYLVTTESDWAGVWNIYDRGVLTPYQVGELLHEMGLRGQPSIISKSELDTFHKPRRVDTVLYDERFERMLQPNDVRTELQSAIRELKHALMQEAPKTAEVGV